MLLIRDVRLLPQCLHDIYVSRCSKISLCSTVARIRSFHVNNTPVGYTSTNTPKLVHGLSLSLTNCSTCRAPGSRATSFYKKTHHKALRNGL